MADENKEEKELAKIGEKVAGAIEKLAKAQEKTAEAQEKQALAQKQEAKAETKEAEAEERQAKAEEKSAKKEKKPLLGGAISTFSGLKTEVGGTVAKAISQSTIIFALIIALTNYYFKFQLGSGVALLHLATLGILFMFNYGLPKSFLFLAALFEIAPLLLPITIGGWFTFFPWFAAFVFISYIYDISREGFTSNFSKITFVFLIVVMIIIGAPKLGYTSVQITATQKEAVFDFFDGVKNYLSTIKEYWNKQFAESMCRINPTSIECQKTVEKEAPVKTQTALPTKFIFKLDKMPETKTFSQQIDETYSYVNLLNKDVSVDFSCEIEDFEKGTPEPSSIILKANERKSNQRVRCIFENTMKKGTRTFNITALIKGIQSESIKYQYFIDEKTKNLELNKYFVEKEITTFNNIAEENAFLQEKWGSFITESVVTKISSEDYLTAAIKQGSGATNPNEPHLLVYGAEQGSTKIPFAVYLQKNKKGTVDKINSISIVLPAGLSLDPVNCGYTSEYLKSINWREEMKLSGEENQYGLKQCDLIITEKLPNVPKLKQIKVLLDYDFEVSEETELTVR